MVYVVAYRATDYVRTRSFRAALPLVDRIDLQMITNRRSGLLRYPEVLGRLLRDRVREGRPALVILGFRGYELFWPVRLVSGAPVILDAFLSPSNSLISERKHGAIGRYLGHPLRWFERQILNRARLILADTDALVEYFASELGINTNKCRAIPVGSDQVPTGVPAVSPEQDAADGPLRLLFYGSMLALHGLSHVLDAVNAMPPDAVHLRLIGGEPSKVALAIHRSGVDPNCVEYSPWVPLDRIVTHEIGRANLCIGGPFGDTAQAQGVITGKTYDFLAIGSPTLVGHTNVHDRWGFVNRENCLMAEQGSSTAIVDALTWAVDNRTALDSVGRAGLDLFRDRFSSQQIASCLGEAIQEVLGSSTR